MATKDKDHEREVLPDGTVVHTDADREELVKQLQEEKFPDGPEGTPEEEPKKGKAASKD